MDSKFTDNFSVVQSLKGLMKSGIPEAGLPPLDPLNLDNVELNLAGAHIEFRTGRICCNKQEDDPNKKHKN